MASHEYSPQADIDHFGFLVDEQIALLKNTTSLPVDVLESTARSNALIIFNTTYASNIRSLFHEADRHEEVFGSEFHMVDGKITADGYGTPETMLARTKEKSPQLYNEEEAQAILHGVKLIEHGIADAFAYSMYHESGTRYVAFFEKVGKDTWKPRSVDVGKSVGRDLTQAEGADVIRLLHERRSQDTKLVDEGKFPLLIIEKAQQVSAKDVVEASLMRSFVTAADPTKMAQSIYYKEIGLQSLATPQPLLQDRSSYLLEALDVSKRLYAKSTRDIPFKGLVANVLKDTQEVGRRVIHDSRIGLEQVIMHIGNSLQEKRARILEKPKEGHSYSPQQKHRIVERIVFSRKEGEKSVQENPIFQQLHEKRVALALVPVAGEFGFALQVLSILSAEVRPAEKKRSAKKAQKREEERKRGREEERTVKKSENATKGKQKERKRIRRTKLAFFEQTRILKKEPKHISRKRSIFLLGEERLHQNEKRIREGKSKRREKIKRTIFIRSLKERQVIPTLRVENPLGRTRDRRVSRIGKKEHGRGEPRIRHVKQLLRVLKDLSRKRNVHKKVASEIVDHTTGEKTKNRVVDKKQTRRHIGMRRENQMKEKQTIVSMAMCWVIWLLFQSMNERTVMKKVGIKQHVSISDTSTKDSERTERLYSFEQTPWILLSIIWYLTIIREHGVGQTVHGSPQGIRTKKKKTKQYRDRVVLQQGNTSLQPSGIIYQL
ncbi:hypothetical protein HY409_04000 [Candidatus Gottesmanbacteria bacterium]|nr:hypothetical protein [Candidatus Gottesmanbacteria bacterium]